MRRVLENNSYLLYFVYRVWVSNIYNCLTMVSFGHLALAVYFVLWVCFTVFLFMYNCSFYQSTGYASIIWYLFQDRVHKKCSGIKGSMSKVAKSLICRGCLNPVTSAGRTSVDIGATAKLELVDKFCYLGDMLSGWRCWCSCGGQNSNWLE